MFVDGTPSFGVQWAIWSANLRNFESYIHTNHSAVSKSVVY